MPAFTVHIDKNSLGTLDGLERMVLIPEKFSGLALALGPIWLLWHRLFLALAGWGVFFVLTILLVVFLGLPVMVLIAAAYGMTFMLGLEGNNFRRHRLEKRGFAMVDVTHGEDIAEAEERFLARGDYGQISDQKQLSENEKKISRTIARPEQIGGLI